MSQTWKKYWPVLFLVAGLLLVTAGLAYRQFTIQIDDPEPAQLPEIVAELPLTHASYGAEALAEVTRLHGQEFPLSSGAFGVYGSTDAAAILWVAGAPSSIMSRRMISQMEEAIETGDSPFTPTGTRQVDGRTIYELTGMGQEHYYFRSGKIVVWLAADAPLADTALADTLAFYP